MQNPSEYIVFDLETQRSIQEVGSRKNFSKLGVSVAVLYDSRTGATEAFREQQIDDLIERLQNTPLVVGFNIVHFDYRVLQGYSNCDFRSLPSVDLMQHIVEALGFRLSLDSLAQATLNATKSASGLQAIAWYQQGEWQKLTKYCRDDVLLTRDLYEYGKEHGYVLHHDKRLRRKRKIWVSW
ncbi:MAG: ribonuclease H-like domain-containing protein [bacterium]